MGATKRPIMHEVAPGIPSAGRNDILAAHVFPKVLKERAPARAREKEAANSNDEVDTGNVQVLQGRCGGRDVEASLVVCTCVVRHHIWFHEPSSQRSFMYIAANGTGRHLDIF